MKQLLVQAKEEIERLRTHNKIMSAEIEVMDLFACVLYTRAAGRGEGLTDAADIVGLLSNEIDALKKVEDKKKK